MNMKRCLLLLGLFVAGCAHAPPCPSEPNVSRFHDPAFAWRRVARMVILPMVNESPQPQAGEEVRRSLHAELQQLALFEAVPAPLELTNHTARLIRDGGRFSEAEMVALARCGAADVILIGTLTHYSPYQRPRIGLTLQAISPDLGRVVASVDGLWDSTDHEVADRARAYYARCLSTKQKIHDHITGRWEESYGTDLVLESPHLFQRFVCSEAAHLLVGLPVGRPIDEEPPIWRPGSILLTVKACLESCLPKKPPCPPPTPPGEAKPASPSEKKAANNAPEKASNKGRDKKEVLPPPTPVPEKDAPASRRKGEPARPTPPPGQNGM